VSLTEAVRVLQTWPEGFEPERVARLAAGLRRVVVLRTLWYPEIIDGMVRSAREFLLGLGVSEAAIEVRSVPGSFELPLGAAVALHEGADFVVALGCVVRGGTPHFEYVCQAATDGLMRVQLDSGKPVGFGLLTVDDIQQAQARLEKGAEAAHAAFFLHALAGRRPPHV
jgi:6,7-dimethyl-8-ribityllumazine synthase